MTEAINEPVGHLITFFKPADRDSMTSLVDFMPIIFCAKKNKTVTISYQLSGQWGTISIYNASDQSVEQKNADKNLSNLLLDVSG